MHVTDFNRELDSLCIWLGRESIRSNAVSLSAVNAGRPHLDPSDYPTFYDRYERTVSAQDIQDAAQEINLLGR